jgi:hypothetical protein
VRQVQAELLKAKAYLLPYMDVNPADKEFAAIQRIGVTGILKGKGIPYKWANQTWFYPDSTVTGATLVEGFKEFNQATDLGRFASHQPLTVNEANKIIAAYQNEKPAPAADGQRLVSRRELAVLIDNKINPFNSKVSFTGHWIK